MTCAVEGCPQEVMGCNKGGDREGHRCEAEIYCSTHFLAWASGKIKGPFTPSHEQEELTKLLKLTGRIP